MVWKNSSQKEPGAVSGGPGNGWPMQQPPPYAGGYGYAPQPYSAPPQPPAKREKRRARLFEVALMVIALAMAAFVLLCAVTLIAVAGGFSTLTQPTYYNASSPAGTFSVIQVQGTIQNAGSGALGINDPSYHHGATVSYIKALAEQPGNTGILLFMNTGGGGVYESEELYRALAYYKETTGRPVWGYMAMSCASGGYYACMAADRLVADINTTTGSIGVYIALTDTSGLYEKLGIETVIIGSGDLKGATADGLEISDEVIEMYQSSVDEKYKRFVNLVSESRGLAMDEVLKLADGRVFTGQQAKENGLIDDIGEWEEVLADFEAETGGTAHYPSFSGSTPLGTLISAIQASLPKSETETALGAAEQIPAGVPMYMDPSLM